MLNIKTILTLLEKKVIVDITNESRAIIVDLGQIDIAIYEMLKSKKLMLDKYELVQAHILKLTSLLLVKYGKGTINIETFLYIKE